MHTMQVLEDIQRFLGVEPQQLNSGLVKVHTGPLWETLENYDEVKQQLEGTPMEWMLTADNT